MSSISLRIAAGRTLVCACVLFQASLSTAQTYVITDLGSLGGSSAGLDVNASGQVTGWSYIDTVLYPFLFNNGTMTNLGTLGGSLSEGAGINARGHVTGFSFLAGDTNYRAFLYSDGVMNEIVPPGTTDSRASDINDLDQVVGFATLDGGGSVGFLSDRGQPAKLLGASIARAINNAGQVTGAGYGAHAFLYSGNEMTDLGTLGGEQSDGLDINSSGEVTGYSLLPDGITFHAFVYSGGAMTDLGTLGGPESYGYGINGSGKVVGLASAADFTYRPFLYTPGKGMVDLQSLLPSSASGWTLVEPTAINDAGQITGAGVTPDGSFHAFLLSPIDVVVAQLVNGLVAFINAQPLPLPVKTRLLSSLQQIPGRIDGLSCSQKSLLVTKVEVFKAQIPTLLRGRTIQPGVATELLRLADLLINALTC